MSPILNPAPTSSLARRTRTPVTGLGQARQHQNQAHVAGPDFGASESESERKGAEREREKRKVALLKGDGRYDLFVRMRVMHGSSADPSGEAGASNRSDSIHEQWKKI
ncbi:uncharacterized protein TrAtP1_007825 [Trichoderma atroviride]|uniref:Uncharacterized protein n=1 Tax=Hypocrea atroviridis (strain ATCC 20476 / IMI 206040) TaxID=452589 RepID=G9NH61_HYPAI|nr:uncharacterized protein TRIATDRAFT_314802 [Trichoderma atroviride IMI 206040]EHK49956.1 hypothetical protein TRIATDRAFT_314802 [Trichoderma atroviride IMI 206040]UKZ66654.1 hypothetical protein TrAtP1_007825 [Trichoderma atroviride]